MCFDLGRQSFMTHEADNSDKCYKRNTYTKKIQNKEQREELLKRLATRTKAARRDKEFDRVGMQQNSTKKNPKSDRSVQSQQLEVRCPILKCSRCSTTNIYELL
jgi:hypothetical protein